MTFAARFEDAPRVWGVGRVVTDGVVTPWAVSQADVDDEAEALAPRLMALGLGEGDLILIVSLLSQAIHAVPLEKAAGIAGALYSSADATPFDAFRTVSLVRQLQPKVVFGVDGGVLDGLTDNGRDPAEVFAAVGAVVAADADSEARLSGAGLQPGRWVRLGPTSVIRAPRDDGFTYDTARWQVDDDDGRLLLSNVAPRLTRSDRLPTGVRGHVVEPGRLVLA